MKGEPRDEAIQRALDNARTCLIQRIRVNIQSNVRRYSEEVNNRSYSEHFATTTQATSQLEVQGLNWENDYDNNVAFVIAFAEREKLAAYAAEKGKKLRTEIRDHMNFGRDYEKTGQRSKALEEYLACQQLFSQVDEAMTVFGAVSTRPKEAFMEMDSSYKRDEVSISEVHQAIQRLANKPISSIDDVAWNIAYNIRTQSGLKDTTVMVTPFSYQDTKFSSQFGRYFQQTLELKLFDVAKLNAVKAQTNVKPGAGDVYRQFASASGAAFILSGTYWENGSDIKFMVTLRNVSTGKTAASIELIVSGDIVKKTGQNLKPENFQQAYADQKTFAQDEVIGGGLSLEAWTNKGVDNLMFVKGERMKVFVRVNTPCYIRFVYHLADGVRTLLLDSYYIDQQKINQVYEIPDEFECDAPYGAEVLQINACTDPFPPVKTVDKDGYKFYEGDLKTYVVSTRGMKKAAKTMTAETRLVITTMAQ
jgi:hypothetical protein